MKMDRRQLKTRKAIFQALSSLLQKKHFNNITVQEIIEEADIGRSTFYAHFETKDDLLKALCEDIFDHIFSAELKREKTHDFSEGAHDLGELLEHILCHLQDDSTEIRQILSSESEELFMRYFKASLKELFLTFHKKESRLQDKQEVPLDFQIDFLVAGFVEAVRWWIRNRMKYSPEEVAAFYMQMIQE